MDKEELQEWLYQNFTFIPDGRYLDLVPTTEISEMIDEQFKRDYDVKIYMFTSDDDSPNATLVEFLQRYYNVSLETTSEVLRDIYNSTMSNQ
jgi:hypothetical protein